MSFLDWKQIYFDRAVFERIDTLFPSLQFTRNYRGYWQSPYKLDGSNPKRPRKDKTIVSDKNPAFALEQGGQSILLTELYAQLNAIDRATALATMAKAVGVELPKGNGQADYTATMATVEQLNQLVTTMANRLTSDTNEFAYLQSRGYDSDYIDYLTSVCHVGICTPTDREQLKQLFKDSETHVNKGIGTTNTLAIPYYTNGRCIGIAFRAIDTATIDTKGKYLYAWAKGYSQQTGFYGLQSWGYQRNAKGLKALTVVEGQFDAIAAAYHGIPNVVAVGGNEIYVTALQAAKARNIDTIILLLDSDIDTAKIEKAATIIATATDKQGKPMGLRCLVANLPYARGAKDLDTYLNQSKGTKDNVLQAIDQTHPPALHLFSAYRCKAVGAGATEVGLTTIEGLKNELLRLTDQPYTKPTDLGLLVTALNTWTGGVYTIDGLKQEQAQALERATQEQAHKTLVSLISNGLSMATKGDTVGAIDTLTKGLTDLKPSTQAATFAHIIAPPTIDTLKAILRETPVGLPTCYTLTDTNGNPAPLLLPVGLTLVGALPANGKSRMLLNLAIDQVKQGGAKVLYLSFEETHTALTLQVNNLLTGLHLSGNNLRTLANYYNTGNAQYFRAGMFDRYKAVEPTALDLQTSGRLCIVDYETIGTTDTPTLCNLLRYTHQTEGLKAVFIDYVQLLTIDNSPLSRNLELAHIARMLQATANGLGVPIIAAAQLNRESLSPVDMKAQNLSDSADLERNAHTVLALWNSFQPFQKGNTYYTAKGELSPAANHVEGLGFSPNTNGQIYAKLVKCRGAAPNSDTVLNFDGNTGAITHSPIDTLATIDTRPTIDKGANEVPF